MESKKVTPLYIYFNFTNFIKYEYIKYLRFPLVLRVARRAPCVHSIHSPRVALGRAAVVVHDHAVGVRRGGGNEVAMHPLPLRAHRPGRRRPRAALPEQGGQKHALAGHSDMMAAASAASQKVPVLGSDGSQYTVIIASRVPGTVLPGTVQYPARI